MKMLKRFELHNHTCHSDAALTCLELVQHMEKDCVDVLALTDHNTISGHREMKEILQKKDFHVQAVYGMEVTTYYGHILCLNLHRYVPWETIDRHRPEKLFEACQRAGAFTGVAHPFSYGAPFARGCRFEMEIHDITHVDFIEIFNNPEPLYEVNGPGLRWWEDLCLDGEKLAATAGMDLHGPADMSRMFATYLEGTPEGNPEKELEKAIRSGQTWVSKGMILLHRQMEDGWHFTLQDMHKPGSPEGKKWLMTLRGMDEERTFVFTGTDLKLEEQEIPAGPVVIVKLFLDDTDLKNLICVSPVLYRKEGCTNKVYR